MYLYTAKRKCKGEWAGVARSIEPVEEHQCTLAQVAVELERRFPGARVPPSIVSRHDLNRFIPVVEMTPWRSRFAPPHPCFRRGRARSYPYA